MTLHPCQSCGHESVAYQEEIIHDHGEIADIYPNIALHEMPILKKSYICADCGDEDHRPPEILVDG